jgi:hypothetical protein
MAKILTLKSIFEKDQNGKYTIEALLYQDILRFPIKTNCKKFKFWELGRWLIYNNAEFCQAYDRDLTYSSKKNTTITYAVLKKQDRIKAKIEDLIHLDLLRIEETAKATKVNTDIPLYAHTRGGYLISWILEWRNLTQREKANNEIYNIIDSTFKIEEGSSSITIFYSYFFRKCWEKRVFDKLIQHILDIAHSKSHAINNIHELFEHLVDLGFKDEKTRKDFWNIWLETITELDTKTQQLVIHQMKLDAERRFQNKKEYLTSEYEEMRFLYRGDYSRIAVEGNCEKCNLQQGSVMLDVLDYREALSRVAPTDSIRSQCPVCHTKDSLVIPNFNF